jgi:hypothetical protein
MRSYVNCVKKVSSLVGCIKYRRIFRIIFGSKFAMKNPHGEEKYFPQVTAMLEKFSTA